MSTSEIKITGILIKDKKKPAKKTVRWNDDKNEGKMSDSSITIHEAASLSKKEVDEHIKLLIKAGYSEIEATAIAGKSITPNGELMLNNGIFYESRAMIAARKNTRERERERAREISDNQEEENNRYSFFSIENASIFAAATATLAIGAFLMLKK